MAKDSWTDFWCGFGRDRGLVKSLNFLPEWRNEDNSSGISLVDYLKVYESAFGKKNLFIFNGAIKIPDKFTGLGIHENGYDLDSFSEGKIIYSQRYVSNEDLGLKEVKENFIMDEFKLVKTYSFDPEEQKYFFSHGERFADFQYGENLKLNFYQYSLENICFDISDLDTKKIIHFSLNSDTNILDYMKVDLLKDQLDSLKDLSFLLEFFGDYSIEESSVLDNSGEILNQEHANQISVKKAMDIAFPKHKGLIRKLT